MSVVLTLDTVGIPDHHHISQCNFICPDGQGKQAGGQRDVSMAPRVSNPQSPEVACLLDFIHYFASSIFSPLRAS